MPSSESGVLERRRFAYPDLRFVLSGVRFDEALAEVADELGATRIVAFVSRSLLASTDMQGRLREALGERLVQTIQSAGADILDADVIAHAQRLRAARCDLVVTIGGGALVDTVKMSLLAHAHDVETVEQLHRLRARKSPEGHLQSGCSAGLVLRQVVVPTTLTGAEYSDLAGSAPSAAMAKAYYMAPGSAAIAVVLDPWLSVHTPPQTWLSSGMRGIDHAIEGYCSVRPNQLVDATCLQTLRLLRPGLQACAHDPNDVAARDLCQTGAWLAGMAVGRVPFGASHGLGHLLVGLAGIPHGLTSALLLPAVLGFNLPMNAARQQQCAQALGAGNAADAVRSLVKAIGLDRALAELSADANAVAAVAQAALDHFVVRTNPRALQSVADVEEILSSTGLRIHTP